MRRTVKLQLAFVSIVVGLVALLMGVRMAMTTHEKLSNIQNLQSIVSLSTSISLLVHESQKERGTSAGYLGSSGKKFADKLLATSIDGSGKNTLPPSASNDRFEPLPRFFERTDPDDRYHAFQSGEHSKTRRYLYD